MKKILISVIYLFVQAQGQEIVTTAANSRSSVWKMGGMLELDGHNMENSDFRKELNDHESFISDELLLNLNFTPSDKISAFVEFMHSGNFGERRSEVDPNTGVTIYRGQSGTDTNRSNVFSLHQAYGKLNFLERSSLKIGRQEIDYGNGFVIASDDKDWFGNPRAFDAFQLELDQDLWKINFLYSPLRERSFVSTNRYGSVNSTSPISGKDSNTAHDNWMGGFYLNNSFLLNRLDLFYFHHQNGDYQNFNTITQASNTTKANYETWKLHTFGTTLEQKFWLVRAFFNGALQRGTTRADRPAPLGGYVGPGEGKIKAHAMEFGLDMELDKLFKPKLALTMGKGSGNIGVSNKSIPIDSDSQSETYNDEWGNRSYNGLANIFSNRGNLLYYKGAYSGAHENLRFEIALFKYSKVTLHDDPPITRSDIAHSTLSTGSYPVTIRRHSSDLGKEFDFQVLYSFTKTYHMDAGVYLFKPGNFFLEQKPLFGQRLRFTYVF